MQQQPSGARTVERGQQSNIDAPLQVVVRTEAEWTKLWQQHAPDRPRPAIDFSKEMVVGVFLGSRPTGGFSVAIVSATPKDGTVIVSYKESRPRPGVMTAQVLTFPFHIVAVPKTAGEVRFEKMPQS
jgi:hypothetical protein